MAAQHGDGSGVEVETASRVCRLDVGDGGDASDSDDRLADMQHRCVEVDVGPAQPAQLPSPQTGHSCYPDEGAEEMVGGLLEEGGQLPGCPCWCLGGPGR